MTPKHFRATMLFLAVVAILLLISIFVYIILRPVTAPSSKYILNSTPCSTCDINQCKPVTNTTYNRDIRVLEDPLYPPLNRTEEPIFNNVVRQIQTNPTNDSYHLVGYLINQESVKDAGGNNWKLFGRMKDRHQGDYYIIPTNNNIDLKIPLTNDIVVGERLRDMYTLPKEMQFKSPMLNTGIYEYTEIPKTDFMNSRYI